MLSFLDARYRDVADYLAAGGPVMLPLALVSLAMWLLIADRLMYFRRLHRKNMSRREAADHIRRNRRPDPARYQGVVFSLVDRFLQRRGGKPEIDRFILEETAMTIDHRLDDHLNTIKVLSRLAPLLGLLGTVTGMIDTFEVLTLFGTGNPNGMASGISEALITTETGLVVAIPGFYMQSFLDRRARNLKQTLRNAGFHLRRTL
jgi:biopolymer transport protein ExbB